MASMSSTAKARAEEYRRRAEDARAKAEAMTNEVARKKMLDDAATWDRMAAYEERQATRGTT